MTPSTRRSKAKGKPRRRARSVVLRRAPWLLGLVLVMLACGVGGLKWSRSRSGRAVLLGLGADRLHAEVQATVAETLQTVLPRLTPGPAAIAADHDHPAPQFGAGAAIRCRVVAVDDDRPWWRLQADLERVLAGVGAGVLWGERLPRVGSRTGADAGPDEGTDLLRLDIGVRGHPTHTLLLHRAGTTPAVRWAGGEAPTAWQRLAEAQAPTVALVIDDWGFGRNETTRRILELEVPLTLAVLPGEAYSRHFALQGTELLLPAAAAAVDPRGARAGRLAAGCPVELTLEDPRRPPVRRREIMLHMPMQPQSWPETDPGPRAVMVGMDRAEIGARLVGALTGLPGVRGVNNHMGSAATSDGGTMADFMAVLRDRDLYFVDSLTSARSVAWETARDVGVPTVRNRIFLDYDNEDPESIRANLETLVRSARQRGFALGIGHPHPSTADVLRRELPRLQAAGVRFVTVSELLALRRARAGGTS